jgi:DNA-binding NtrC family response regulator
MAPFELVVFHCGTTRTVALPARGTVGIGRDPEQAVRLDDSAVSRHHATLTLETSSVVLEDEGSANGTVVVRGDGDDTVEPNPRAMTAKKATVVREPVALGVGDSVFMGAAVLVLRRAPAATGNEGPMAALHRLVDQIAPSPIRVLLHGETGVGKEVLAERIHQRSTRAAGPLVKVHCGGLSETLLESELFGHERGAFTGAVRDHVGFIEAAHGGTLLLDEVGETSPSLQVKLLRVLEDGRVQRVGSTQTRAVDVRIVSATHRDLSREVKAGRFRQDLYFRLNGITLRIPPLRDRRDEILPLARELLARSARQSGRQPPSLDDRAQARLAAHDWPGNVRELRQVMERALALGTADTLGPEHVLLDEAPLSSVRAPAAPAGATLREEMEALERKRIEDALAACGGNQSKAADMLGMPRRTLVERLSAWGKTRSRKKRSADD